MRLLKIAKIMIAAVVAVFALSVNSYAGAWMHDNNGWWYCNDNRSYTTDNWQQINGAWYYFDSWGYMVTGWKQVGGSWYYLHADGKVAHDTWIDGTYYVGSDGRMLKNTTTPDGYRVGADGKWTNNTAVSNSSSYIGTWTFDENKTDENIYGENRVNLFYTYGTSMFEGDNLLTIKADGKLSWSIGCTGEEGTWTENNGVLLCSLTDQFGDRHKRTIKLNGNELTMELTGWSSSGEKSFISYWHKR